MKKVLFAIVAVLIIQSLGYSQGKPPSAPPKPIEPAKPADPIQKAADPIVTPAKYKCDLGDEASIDNNSGKDVYLSYSSDEENWTTEKIESNKTFKIRGTLSTQFYIRIISNGNSQIKKISNKCYYLVWNTGKDMWELNEYK